MYLRSQIKCSKSEGPIARISVAVTYFLLICTFVPSKGLKFESSTEIKNFIKVTTIYPPTSDTNDGTSDQEPRLFKNNTDGNNNSDFGADDLVDLVEELEMDALDEETAELIPEIYTFLNGAMSNNKSGQGFNSSSISVVSGPMGLDETKENDDEDLQDDEEDDDEDNDEDDDEFEGMESRLLPGDLSDLTEDIAEDISAGVEESLKLFQGSESVNGSKEGDQAETRQMSMYLFQGQYVPEPRLNRFIDGAFRNMGTEMKISSMDPLFFRVLPRGRVAQRGQPVQPALVNRKKPVVRRRRPGKNKRRKGRQIEEYPSQIEEKESPIWQNGTSLIEEEGRGRFSFRRRGQAARRRQQQRNRRKRLRARKRRRQRQRIRKRQRQRKRNRQKLGGKGPKGPKGPRGGKRRRRNKKKRGKNKKGVRIRRRVAQNVGGGRVEGLSRVQRDSDAEMQLFGNYTLIRSHMRVGPVELTMQFRTRKGIRRTGATLPVIRAHTVTRVNHEGSEMVDFLLDRPHPETIRVRGNLFPLAQKIAQNIFARLFLPDSFLVEKVREKTGLALLSKPIDTN